MIQKKLEKDDIIMLNKDFAHNEFKLVLNIKNKNLNPNFKKEEVSHFVLDDRKYLLDAVIMKILKFYKRLEFDKLKFEIINAVHNYFIPEISLIKTRLENLIERDFISRDNDNANIYIFSIY